MPLFGELFLSNILKKPVLDQKGEVLGLVRDLIIVKGKPLPEVASIIITRKKESFLISWAGMNIFNKRIMSANLSEADLSPYDPVEEDLLAVRDILDKQIVDANGVKVVRVNDIKFEGYEGLAVLTAVDVGMRGILRRLGFERFGEDVMSLFRVNIPYHLISWNYIQSLQPKLSMITLTVPRKMVADLHPADLADLLSQVSTGVGAQFIEGLDAETAADAMVELETDTQKAMITDMDPEIAADIIEEMPPDEAADLISELPDEKAMELLDKVEPEEAEDIHELLGHEADTAGGLMTTEYIGYPPSMTVAEIITRFRQDAPQIENVYYLYAVDEAEKVYGVASLKDILVAAPETTFEEIMETKIKSISPEADEMEVARLITKYNLVALPVVDNERCMLGIVTVDDILDRLLPPHARRPRRGV